MAVDTPDGLVVPVIRDVGSRSADELRQDIDRLKRAARDRTVAAGGPARRHLHAFKLRHDRRPVRDPCRRAADGRHPGFWPPQPRRHRRQGTESKRICACRYHSLLITAV